MSTNETYLAVFLGHKDSPRVAAWNALSEADRHAKGQEGMTAWKAWAERHQPAIVAMGGPLGKTKQVGEHGVEDVSNALSAFMVIRAASHAEAANMFKSHPHFTIFPGDAVEVMPVLPIPGS